MLFLLPGIGCGFPHHLLMDFQPWLYMYFTLINFMNKKNFLVLLINNFLLDMCPECTRIHLRASTFKFFSGVPCPRTRLEFEFHNGLTNHKLLPTGLIDNPIFCNRYINVCRIAGNLPNMNTVYIMMDLFHR